jgi:hypothetical protein
MDQRPITEVHGPQHAPAALSGWTTSYTFAGTQQVVNSWNALPDQKGRQVRATNETYNAALAPRASTTWDAVVNGTAEPLPELICTVR